MTPHPLRQIIESCDRAITTKNYDALMKHYAEDALVVKPGMVVKGKDNIRSAFVAISDYFQDQLIVEQGEMQVIEGGDNALVIMETVLRFPDGQGGITEIVAPRDLCFSAGKRRSLALYYRQPLRHVASGYREPIALITLSKGRCRPPRQPL